MKLWLVSIGTLASLTWFGISVARADDASYFGPGLYGNHMACGGVLSSSTIGVAHRTLKCGTIVTICYRSRCTDAPVVDRGPWNYSRVLDLTTAVAYRLCGCYTWGVRSVTWHLR